MSKIIAFEGIDGIGKSTQMRLLYEFLIENQYNSIMTQELAGPDLREKIRDLFMSNLDPIEELLALSIARRWHYRHIVHPALSTGRIILMDRYIDSTWAYQFGGRKIPRDIVKFMEQRVWDVFPPDLVIYLQGKSHREVMRDRFEREDPDFFKNVEKIYSSRVKPNWLVVNATEPVRKIQITIQSRVMELLENKT